MSTARSVAAVAGGTVLAGAATLGYAGLEAHAYRLSRVRVPVLAPGAAPFRILQIADLHITPAQRRKVVWVRSLAGLQPDLVVDTGDNLSHRDGVPTALEALEPLLRFPGAFVTGSNDYSAPVPRNPFRYLIDRRTPQQVAPPRRSLRLPTEQLVGAFVEAGWFDLDNARGIATVGERRVAFVGTGDAHIARDDYAVVAGPPPAADLAIALTHAPYHRVLDALSRDGWPLVIAGHTHGGQVCIPGWGAVVTNCDLDRKRARGLSSYGRSWLYVSAGLGTSRYAPVRFACPPEATLLTLVAR